MSGFMEKSNRRKYFLEKLSGKLFLICAFISVISLALIISFVFFKGFRPFVAEGYNFIQFLLGYDWVPGEGHFGVFPDSYFIIRNDWCFNYRCSNRTIYCRF